MCRVLRYQIPSWDDLTLKEQQLVYYLNPGWLGRARHYVGSKLSSQFKDKKGSGNGIYIDYAWG